MSRIPMVAGNWKMNKTAAQARALIEELLPGLQSVPQVERVVCPVYLSIPVVSELLKGTGIGVGAQNLFWEASGAYTGEVAAQMIKEFCQYVIIGHSERRTYFGEMDATVNKRLKAAIAADLIPIVCVGETLAENEAGQTRQVVTRQVVEGLKEVTEEQAAKIVIAYEPVWAIGTGRAASGEGANAVVADFIRPAVANVVGAGVAQGVRVLYGGSVTGANGAEFFGQPDIDGALVGGASLKPDFIQIIQAAKK
ncbi:MAG TPA: triose-phosphate isomerase [Longilinea sp.]|nr:triose-phosphate isomerase [Longilinea sp.]